MLDLAPATLSATQSTSSSQNSDIRFPLAESSPIHYASTHTNHHNSTYFFAEKTSSLNSPSSSNETAPSSAISPPPEYSKLDVDFKDESSSISSNQNLPKDTSPSAGKMNGILKISSKTLNRQQPSVDMDLKCEQSSVIKEKEMASFGRKKNSDINTHYQSTPVNDKLKENCFQRSNRITESAAKSTAKSVSFDPTIEDKDETEKRFIRRVRVRSRYEHDDCSDSHSCSSCSTCSSSSSDDEEGFELDLANYSTNRQSRPAFRAGRSAGRPSANGGSTQVNNDACTIS